MFNSSEEIIEHITPQIAIYPSQPVGVDMARKVLDNLAKASSLYDFLFSLSNRKRKERDLYLKVLNRLMA